MTRKASCSQFQTKIFVQLSTPNDICWKEDQEKMEQYEINEDDSGDDV